MTTLRDRLRKQLADCKMPGALEAVDDILHRIDAGELTAGPAMEALLGSHIALRNQRRLQTAIWSARLPIVKTFGDFDFAFQPSVKRDQLDSLHTLRFLERKENVVFLGPPGVGKTHLAISLAVAAAESGRRVYYATLADLIAWLEDARQAGHLTRRLRTLVFPSLMVVEEIGYLPISRTPGHRARFLDGASRAEEGTGQCLIEALVTHRPGLILTTSHGQTGPLTDSAQMARMLGVPVDQTLQAVDTQLLTKAWAPAGAAWYCHACCSAGSDTPSAFESLFPDSSDVGRVLRAVAGTGPRVAPLPVALLGAKRPLRAFIGHVEPTFDWTLKHPATSQPLTNGIVSALYPNLYQISPRILVGHAFRDWFQRLGPLFGAGNAARDRYNTGARNTDELMLRQLAARDVQSTVILGDPAAMLPLRARA